MLYYKATRPDGTDFHTGTVSFRVGESLPVKPELDSYECCTGQVFHASDTPSETLIGCSWPCRLFKVAGDPVAQSDHKFGFRTFRVVREIESWRALGPNGKAVAAMIERCREVTPDHLDRLGRIDHPSLDWGSVTMGTVWEASALAVETGARLAAALAAQDAARDAVSEAMWDFHPRRRAWEQGSTAVVNAVRALVVKDLIPVTYFNLMRGPWESVTGAL